MSIRIVSFNLHGDRVDRDGHSFTQRADRIVEILSPKNADIMFFQECIKGMFEQIKTEYGKKYLIYNSYLGEFMDTTVLWDRKRFECLKTGYFWLSDTPKEYSRSWDNFRRYCNYVSLKERESGKCFTCVSVHIGIGDECQQKSVDLICEYVKEISGYPCVIAGTFNILPNSAPYKKMCENYTDINAVTAKDWRVTYHKYEPERFADDHVDYCFIGDGINPVSYSMIDNRYPQIKGKYPTKYTHRYPSDHYGIECEIDLV